MAKSKSGADAAAAGKPKRPMSAYFLWWNANRSHFKNLYPTLKIGELSKKAGEVWRAMADKSEWEQKAQDAKVEYERAITAYKAANPDAGSTSRAEKKRKKTPVPAVAKKRKKAPLPAAGKKKKSKVPPAASKKRKPKLPVASKKRKAAAPASSKKRKPKVPLSQKKKKPKIPLGQKKKKPKIPLGQKKKKAKIPLGQKKMRR